MIDLGISYREDPDRVARVLRDIGQGLQADPAFSPWILAPVEVMGVDAFADWSVVMKMRIKTVPLKQWEVGREFRKRIKKRFEEEGIEIPFPHQTIYFGVDSRGEAPPAHIRLEEPRPARQRAASEPQEPLTKRPEGEQPGFEEVVLPEESDAAAAEK